MANYDFIELTFDGQKTSDLNLYVVSNSGRYTSSLSPQFENRTTSVPGRPGLLYWGTDLGVQEFTVSLATDKLSGEQLNTLKKLFVPGKLGTLSFKETEYKYYKVLLTAQPTFSFVPFIDYDINKEPFGIYKGEIELSLTTLEPYGYSTDGLYAGDPNSPGRKESGLPTLDDFPTGTTIYYIAGGVRIRDKIAVATKASDVSSVFTYHAGNAPADVDLIFTKTYTLTAESGDTPPKSNWEDFSIDDALLIKPRFITDLEYMLHLVYTTWGTDDTVWAQKKAQTLNTLREELYGPHRDRIIEMVTASGAGLTYGSFIALRGQVATEFFSNVKYRFTLQGTTNQCKLEVTNLSMSAVLYTEDNAGSFNGKFIQLAPSGVLPVNGNHQVIASTKPLFDVEVNFKNTYI